MSMSPSTLSPMKKIAAIAALTLGGAFSASAHIPAEHEAMLKNYEDFIMKMSCPMAQPIAAQTKMLTLIHRRSEKLMAPMSSPLILIITARSWQHL